MSTYQGPKNYSTLSTANNVNYYTSRTLMYSSTRPQTANLVYADKPYKKQQARWNQSASTWRFSSRKPSFTKQQRFRTSQPYSLDIIQPNIKVQRSRRATSFGKGKKQPISQIILRNAKQKPSPNAYSINNLDQSTRNPEKGKTFGNSWDKYQKIYLGYRKDMYSSHFVKNNPPAKYNVRNKPGSNTPSFTAYGRQKMYTQKMTDMMRDVPGPHYSIKDRQVYSAVGVENCNFTTGNRLDLSAPANLHPAGSQYWIPGFCDKYKVTRRKNCAD